MSPYLILGDVSPDPKAVAGHFCGSRSNSTEVGFFKDGASLYQERFSSCSGGGVGLERCAILTCQQVCQDTGEQGSGVCRADGCMFLRWKSLQLRQEEQAQVTAGLVPSLSA